MQAIILTKDPNIYNQLIALKKQTQKDHAHNVARRIHAIVMNMDGKSAPEISKALKVSRSQVSVWIRKFSQAGIDALLEGIRSGRPSKLTFNQLNRFAEILHKGPRTYGFSQNHWSYSLIQKVLTKEFKVKYHPTHLRKILHIMNFSIRSLNKQPLKKASKPKKKQLEWEKKWYPDIKKMRWLQRPG
jgi:transposase